MSGQKITDRDELRALVAKSAYAVLSMADGDTPYAIPINAVWSGEYIYLHSRHHGRKMEILRKNPKVSLTFVPEAAYVLRHNKSSCGASMNFESVCACGTAEILGADSGLDERRAALMHIVRRYGLENLPMQEEILAKTTVIRVRCESIVGTRKPGVTG